MSASVTQQGGGAPIPLVLVIVGSSSARGLGCALLVGLARAVLKRGYHFTECVPTFLYECGALLPADNWFSLKVQHANLRKPRQQ